MLRLDAIQVTRGTFRLTADFSVPKGQRVGVIGASGSGKSMLLGAIAGFDAPESGRILWGEADLTDLPPGDRPVSILFQDQNLFPHLTLRQNLRLTLSPGLRRRSGDDARITTALDDVALGGMEDRKPHQLSGGQIARAALARVLVQARPILLLDEPFGALGPALKAEMLALVSRIAGLTGATVLMVSHDPEDALSFAETAVFLSEGHAAPPVPVDRLFANPPPALTTYLGTGPRLRN